MAWFRVRKMNRGAGTEDRKRPHLLALWLCKPLEHTTDVHDNYW